MIASDSGADGAQWVLQLCHGYDGPFMDCARQYAALFKDTEYKVCTVYFTGVASEEVRRGSASDEVVFLDYSSRQLRGLKLGAITAVRKIAAAREYQLCIAHRFKPTYVALLATSLPVIGIQHAFGVYRRRSRRLLANIFRQRLLLLCVSDSVRDDVMDSLGTKESSRVQTLYNRIDIDAVRTGQLSRAAARRSLELPESAWIIGNVGRLHPDKDQATLIRGFAKARSELPKNSLLVIIGKGKLEAELRQLAADLEIKDVVLFLGQVPDARRFFKAFDVFALTSDHEPFGMVLLEAMAADIPIICADNGGAKEVVEGYGQLFPFANPAALRECILKEYQRRNCLNGFAAMRDAPLESLFSDDAARERFSSIINKRFSFNI
ncbi:glycosyltransferase [Pseudomonas sp. gcc21]|uniref:glycosyltransferase n=1 Tax=Pseudomonas sp. gcc21 TaxID=2726989 RepID=UPI001451B2F0|nr:glycosyltransferase [Pseudomonas sp. gcc21]QJD59015.1 glycosyltransferase [Pseudomonas sp. gcc21]